MVCYLCNKKYISQGDVNLTVIHVIIQFLQNRKNTSRYCISYYYFFQGLLNVISYLYEKKHRKAL